MEFTTLFYVSYFALWLFVILHSLVLLGVVRLTYGLTTNSNVREDVSGVLGKEAPLFEASDLIGRKIRLEDLAGSVTSLLFISPDCRACSEYLEEIHMLGSGVDNHTLLICRASHDECARIASRYDLNVPVIPDPEEKIGQLYGVTSFPTAILIDSGRTVRSFGGPPRDEFEAAILEASPDAGETLLGQGDLA